MSADDAGASVGARNAIHTNFQLLSKISISPSTARFPPTVPVRKQHFGPN
jgi:hypothetical protein